MELEVTDMKLLKSFFSISLLLFIIAGFTGCASLQKDVVASYIPNEEISDISNFEYRLAYIDSEYSFPTFQLSATDVQNRNNACDALIKDISKTFSSKALSNASRARLKALEGRLHLIAERSVKAKELSQISFEYNKDDIQNIILMHRLGIIEDLATASFQKSDKPIILLEQALDFYRDREYAFAVAKFDEAFISTESFYHDAYKELRNKSWELRTINDGSVLASLLSINSITIGQMMLITQENKSIIDFYNGKNRYSESTLFYKLTQKGLITAPAKEKPPRNIFSYTKVSRAMEARFLWNIYCDLKQKPGIKNKYSTNYTKAGKTSPVKDVPVTDEDFDAILGCIEYGLLNLTDGINFNPQSSVSGIEFNESLKKLSSKL